MKASHQPAAVAKRSHRPRLARRLLVLALGLGAGRALAQQAPLPPATPDSLHTVIDLPPASLDSLAAEPLVPAVDSTRLLWLQTPATLYETVADRMGCLQSDMPLHYNEAVLAYVRLFTERQRSYTQRVLEREQFYFPTFEKYLTQYHLPIDLKYLSVVESALIPTAKSPVGAVGLWQFMPPTAGDLHLKRDEWVDERMHPEKATEAACKHLRYLYGLFHDWELVLAAYNWGAGNVHRVMRRTGKKTFWELYPHLPAETRNYVPTFTAVLYAMRYAPDYQLTSAGLRYQHFEPLDTLGLAGQPLDLRRLSRALGYDDSLALNRYNPEVRRGSLPAGYRPYVLRYPSAAREHLGDVDRATLLAYCQPVTDLPRPLLARVVYPTGYVPAAGNLAVAPAEATAPRYRRLRYTVRKGQTLATIAERFDVSAGQLRRWNELSKRAAVRPGQQLVVLQALPAAPAQTAASAAILVAALPQPAAAVDSTAQELMAANLRYAREAQAASRREAAQAQELLRRQRQQTLRAVAQQRADALRLAKATRAAAAEEKAQRFALADAEPAENQSAAESPTLAARPDSSAPAPRHGRSRQVAASQLPPDDNAPGRGRNAALVAPAAEELTPALPAARPGVATAPAGRSATRSENHPAFYTVQPGDNLTKVAQETGVPVAQLREWNQLPPTSGVQAGQRLRLRAEAPGRLQGLTRAADKPALRLSSHTVQRGDTLFNLSKRFNVSVQELRRLNHLQTDDVKLGQKLVVPAAS